MIIRRFDPVSAGKIGGVVYAAIGLIIGVVVAVISVVAGSAVGGTFFGPGVGIGAIVIFPILYGLMGFVTSFLAAAIYNWGAGRVGGIQIDVD